MDAGLEHQGCTQHNNKNRSKVQGTKVQVQREIGPKMSLVNTGVKNNDEGTKKKVGFGPTISLSLEDNQALHFLLCESKNYQGSIFFLHAWNYGETFS